MLFLSLASLFVLQLLGAMLPGPDFFMVLRSSLKYGRNAAVLVALGVASGVLLYTVTVVLFLDYMNNRFLSFIHWISFFGGAYLLYIAYKCFRASKENIVFDKANQNKTKLSRKHLFGTGLGCNLSNPKVIVFFLSLLPLFVMKSDAMWYHLGIIAVMFIATLCWFSFVANVMGYVKVRRLFARHMAKFEKAYPPS